MNKMEYEISGLIQREIPALLIRENVPWRELTSLKVGGIIPVVLEPENDILLFNLLRLCAEKSIRFSVLGNGSNTVGSDSPLLNPVIRLCRGEFGNIRYGRHHVTVGAGVRLSEFIRNTAQNGLGGLSSLVGIPGTIGGALKMNAGAHGVCLSDFLTEMCGVDFAGNPWSAIKNEINWEYRTATIPEDVIITAVIFSLPECGVDEDGLIRAELRRRAFVEPHAGNAGCFFRNISETETAGRLIDEAGCKDLTVGGAKVSSSHANYLINSDNASENDILELMVEVRRRVADKFGFYLMPEVCFSNPDSERRFLAAVPSPKITVLKGGCGSEREISLISGNAVANALRRAGYDVTEIDLTEMKLLPEMSCADVVFPVLHGSWGEGGGIQELMESHGIEFVGSGSVSCRLVLDKITSKELMDDLKLPNAAWSIVESPEQELPEPLHFPVVIKPPCEGSTVGIEIVKNSIEWKPALERAFKFDSRLLVEEFIDGIEATVGVINGEAMPVIEIIPPKGKFYDYDAKYLHKSGETLYLCPPVHIPESQQKMAQEAALKFYHASGARDLLRVDFFMKSDGSISLLEGNSIPGFTGSSLVPKAARQSGISFERLCVMLVKNAQARKLSAV